MGHLSKLTLSAEQRIIQKAKRIARARRISVSALFARYVDEQIEPEPSHAQDVPAWMGPLTRQASGLARLPEGKSDTQLLEDALMKKYGFKK